jgi:hypothetical protein
LINLIVMKNAILVFLQKIIAFSVQINQKTKKIHLFVIGVKKVSFGVLLMKHVKVIFIQNYINFI